MVELKKIYESITFTLHSPILLEKRKKETLSNK